MPRRWHYDRIPEYDADEENDFSCTRQESEDVRVAPGIPTLYEIRKHITDHAWNGDECLPSMTNETVFNGQCEYASTAISEILTGTGKGFGGGDWSLRKRGWFKGDLSSIKMSSGCDNHAYTHNKHCHSWVEFKGKIYDPTFWQFGDEGDEVRVYMFDIGDSRFEEDPEA